MRCMPGDRWPPLLQGAEVSRRHVMCAHCSRAAFSRSQARGRPERSKDAHARAAFLGDGAGRREAAALESSGHEVSLPAGSSEVAVRTSANGDATEVASHAHRILDGEGIHSHEHLRSSLSFTSHRSDDTEGLAAESPLALQSFRLGSAQAVTLAVSRSFVAVLHRLQKLRRWRRRP